MPNKGFSRAQGGSIPITRLAILGCGAITRARHISAAAQHPCVEVAVLVDSTRERADTLRREYRLDCKVTTDYRSIIGSVDAAINALPNHLHAPVNTDLLRAGIHVLCEKPLATSVSEGRACCEAAVEGGSLLAVGMPRRFYQSTTLLSLILGEGCLGQPVCYDWEHGVPFGWASASGFWLSRAEAGGGVLLDEGPHLLDCALHWFGPVASFEYQDDNWGGVESNSTLVLEHRGRFGSIRGRIKLSRTYTLQNRLVVSGPNGSAAVLRGEPDVVIMERPLAGETVRMSVQMPGVVHRDPFVAQLDWFIKSITTGQRPSVDGSEGLQTLELITQCYAARKRLPEPWSEVLA